MTTFKLSIWYAASDEDKPQVEHIDEFTFENYLTPQRGFMHDMLALEGRGVRKLMVEVVDGRLEPVCPPNYDCTFTPNPPEQHHIGPWWEGTWGTVATIAAVIAVAFVLCWLAYYWYESVKDKRSRRAARETREHHLALTEQFTAQMDMAKGDDDMLKIVQEQQRRIEYR